MNIRILLLSISLSGFLFGIPSAITYDFSGGRFGDNLLTYLHAKSFALQQNKMLLYKPFEYSSELIMDIEELKFSEEARKFRYLVNLDRNYIRFINKNDIIFVCPYFPEIQWELNRQSYFTWNVNWKDPKFREIARRMISPKNPLELTFPPKEKISIAIHMREGGGFDDEEHKFNHPLKTPPVTFYADCLKKVLQEFPQNIFHCHVFTDAIDPKLWIEKMLKDVPGHERIDFHYREVGNRHNSSVLEDFFSLFNFDILIRAESNYSIVPSLIHDYSLVYYPKTFSIHDRVVTIDEITVERNMECLEELFKRKSNITEL